MMDSAASITQRATDYAIAAMQRTVKSGEFRASVLNEADPRQFVELLTSEIGKAFVAGYLAREMDLAAQRTAKILDDQNKQ